MFTRRQALFGLLPVTWRALCDDIERGPSVPVFPQNGATIPGTFPPQNITQPDEGGNAVNPAIALPGYLATPPNPILVDLGRQLPAIDDFLVESSSGLTRSWKTAAPYAGNPVVTPDRAWEAGTGSQAGNAFAMPFSNGIWRDPDDGLLKTTYPAGLNYIAMLHSDDGLVWTKPNLGLVSYGGNTNNNIILDLTPSPHATLAATDSQSWIYNPDAHPSQRWVLLYTVPVTGQNAHRWHLRYAARAAGPYSAAQVLGFVVDRSTVHYDSFRRMWVYSDRKASDFAPNRRYRRYYETSDPATWNRANAADSGPGWPWSRIDDTDEGARTDGYPQLYELTCASYESVMLGWRALLHAEGGSGRPKINEITASFSRDGFYWTHSYVKTMGPCSAVPQAWNYGNMQPVGGPPVIRGENMIVYASGRTGINGGGDAHGNCGMGAFILRRGGFASWVFANGASLTTRPQKQVAETRGRVSFIVNALCSATAGLQVEMLDAGGSVIPGFERANCVPLVTNDTRHVVRWTTGADIERLSRVTIKPKFYAFGAGTGAELFEYGWEDTASRSFGIRAGAGRRAFR